MSSILMWAVGIFIVIAVAVLAIVCISALLRGDNW